MLETLYLTKSSVRQAILTLFFTNPSKRFYLRELERLLGYSAGSIRREFLKFQKGNLFKTEKLGNLIYYSLDTKHPLFKELKSIVSKTTGVEGALKKTLSTIKEIKIAFIYGSFAAKREKETSDIDLMVIGNPDTSLLNEKLAYLEKRLQREINITIYSYKEFELKKKEKNGFVKELLKSPRIILAGKEDDL